MSELKLNRHLTFIMPYIFLLLLIYSFASLGFWQLDRAKAKDTLNEAYLSETSYLSIRDDLPIDEYLQIQTTGKYIIEKQIDYHEKMCNKMLTNCFHLNIHIYAYIYFS